jgi:hypothetical protein
MKRNPPVPAAPAPGTIAMPEILQLLETRHFRVIQIEYPASQTMQPTARIRFPGPFMRTLFANYKLAFRTKWYAVFVPKARKNGPTNGVMAD